MKFVGRALTMLAWDNPATAFLRKKNKKIVSQPCRPSHSDFVQFGFQCEEVIIISRRKRLWVW